MSVHLSIERLCVLLAFYYKRWDEKLHGISALW